MKKSMIDRHYYVRTDQDEALRRLSKRLEKKPAELVRESIDILLKHYNQKPYWLDSTRKVKGLLKDYTGIDERIANARKSLERSFDHS